MAERCAEYAHDLLDGVEKNAADKKELIAQCHLFISGRLGS